MDQAGGLIQQHRLLMAFNDHLSRPIGQERNLLYLLIQHLCDSGLFVHRLGNLSDDATEAVNMAK